MTAAWLALVLAATAGADDGPLDLADLPDYRAAFDATGPTEPVRFADLWARPDAFQGRRVRIAGQVARRFRQPAVGKFPPLTETWLFTPEGNPLCLVYPTGTADDAAMGATVAFDGTFLRRVRYQGGDADRLAPLIVGGRPPTLVKAAPKEHAPSLGWSAGDLVITGALAAVVVLALLVVGLRRPFRRERPGPPPEFLDGGAGRAGAE